MGLFDLLTGSKAARPGLPRRPAAELRTALLALNRGSAPWLIRDGRAEGADLVAEWKITDARWYEVFAKANLTKAFRILMKFDESKHDVRAVDEEWAVEWRAGVPTLTASTEVFRGQKVEMNLGATFAFTEHLDYGKVYEYRFTTVELKAPLQDTTAASGWAWRGITFGKL